MSFVGWALLCVASDLSAHDAAAPERERPHRGAGVYLALYNRAGAIVVLLGSYAVAANSQGWPAPQSFIGWFAVLWVPLFVSFTIPVNRNARSSDTDA
jgi:hypothetical protein